jgi:hypothetical protein
MSVLSNARVARLVVQLMIVIVLLLVPSRAGAFSKAIWGEPYVKGQNQFPIYRALGVKVLEIDLRWEDVAPMRPRDTSNFRDPAYEWPADVSQSVSLARRYHMQVLIQIVGSPRWANGGHAWNWVPSPSAYATFAATAAREYPSVHLWMIWGEPNRRPNFQPEATAKPGAALTAKQKIAPHNYARILDAAYAALKAGSKGNVVIGGSTYTTGDIDTEQWIENLRLPDGRPPRMDMYAHNPFSVRAPALSVRASPLGEVMFADLGRMAGWIDHNLRRGMPIFLSEFTLPTAPDQEFGYWVDQSTQAAWISQALRNSRRWSRIWGLGWIHAYDDPPVSYGGLMSVTGVRKPGFEAFARG